MYTTIFQILSLVILMFLCIGTLVNLSDHPHWSVRVWDFPRMQILTIAIICAGIYISIESMQTRSWIENALPFGTRYWVAGIVIVLTAWHGHKIWAYTSLAEKQTINTKDRNDGDAIRILISNVEMENEQYDHWMSVVRAADPDLLIVLEPDTRWMNSILPLREQYEFEIAYPQDNWYGMLLLSRYPLADAKIRFLVQDDVPSIHTLCTLPSGQQLRICALHPRPPEPVRDNDSSHRDAELVLLAEEYADRSLPIIVGGDLNDVAWSRTTQLFLELSGLLDPRRGRGFFSTFHADHPYFRFPLDHVFHSRELTLRHIERLEYVGSDHFPMLIELQYEPAETHRQKPIKQDSESEEEGEEIVEREEERELKSLEHDRRPAIVPNPHRSPATTF